MPQKQERASYMKIEVCKSIHWEDKGNGTYKRIDDLFMCTIRDNVRTLHSFNAETKEEFLKRVSEEISLRLC